MKKIRVSLAATLLGAVILLGIACGGGEQAPAASSGLFLPAGDASAGREVFVELKCYACHTVSGDSQMPAPFSDSRGPAIGQAQVGDTREMIADSIVSPSHVLPPLEEGPMSPMGDYRRAMTMQQLIDVVAFVEAQQ